MMTFDRQRHFLGYCLYFFALYTITIKYLLPIGWSIQTREAWTAYIYFWDAWWIAHLWVGRGLINGNKKIWKWAFLLCLAEIIIIVTKFALFARHPDLDFWHLNWFINKCFLLVYFVVLLAWLFRKDVKSFYQK